MGLDINTPKGQETVKQELAMLKYIEKCWGVQIKITKKDKPIDFDGIIIKDKKVVGIFESKNRQEDLDFFEQRGSWLITFDKLEKCRLEAKKRKVPFYGFLGIELSGAYLVWKISDENGNYLFDFDHYKTKTQASVNGGEAYRDNAYLPIKYSKFIQPNQKIF